MKTYLLLFGLFIGITISHSQNNPATIPEITDEPLLPYKDRKRALLRNLNLLILGDDNIKEGLTYQYNGTKSELQVGANFEVKESGALTVEGQFETNSGSFIFDQNNGGSSATLGLNLFIIAPKLIRKNVNIKSETRYQQAQVKIDEITLEVEKNFARMDSLRAFFAIAEFFDIPSSIEKDKESILNIYKVPSKARNDKKKRDSILIQTLNTRAREILYSKRPNEVLFKKILTKYLPAGHAILGLCYDEIELVISTKHPLAGKVHLARKVTNNNGIRLFYNYADFKTSKFIDDYKVMVIRNNPKKFETYVSDLRINAALSASDSNVVEFMGIHGDYSRESLNLFFPQENFSTLSNLFDLQRRDLYSFGLSYNFYHQVNEKFQYYFKLQGNLGRGTNRNQFVKKNYSFTTEAEEDETIKINEEISGFTHSSGNNIAYQYGFLKSTSLEFYAIYKKVGVYANFRIQDRGIQSAETIFPLEAGVILNLKSAQKQKELANVLLFFQRQNLKNNPNDDFNIGFRLGLPFNLKTKKS